MTDRRPKNPWSILGLLWLVYLLNYLDRQVVFSLLPQLRAELDFSNTQLGLISGLFLWVYSSFSLFAGRLADRVRKDVLIVGSLILWSFATLGGACSSSPGSFLFWRAAVGVSEALYIPAALASIAILHSRQTRSRALSIHQTAQMIGVGVGGVLGAAIAQRFGWRVTLGVLAAAGLIFSPLLWLKLSRSKALQRVTADSQSFLKSKVLLSKSFYWLLTVFTINCVQVWMFYAWFPLHIYDTLHLSLTQSSFVATVYLQVSSIVGIILWGLFADKLVDYWPSIRFLTVAVGILFCAPFGYWAFHSHSLAAIKCAEVGFGFFSAAVTSNLVSAMCDVVESQNHGFAIGILNLTGGIGSGIGTFVAGLWMKSLGTALLMGFVSAIGVLAAVGLWRHVRATFLDRPAMPL